MAEIITDVNRLHQVSEEATKDEITSIVDALRDSIPEKALGLAAIQIDIPKRIFLANLSSGSYAFINPKITWKSIDIIPFTEGCLSIPDITCNVKRHTEVKVTADTIMGFDGAEFPDELHLRGTDSFIIQHEYDHLNGVLITDSPEEVPSQAPGVEERSWKRQQRVTQARIKKEQKKNQLIVKKPQKLNSIKQAKLKKATQKKKKQERRARQREKIRVEIEERYKAKQSNLFNKAIEQ